jgi:hypothetical protein
MKSLIKFLVRESIEEEIRQKGELGMGRDHIVYPFEKDPSKVIKIAYVGEWGKPVGSGVLKASHIEKMLDYPDIFPKVYKHNDRYAIIEKLNTDEIENDDEILYDVVSKYDLSLFNSSSTLSAIEEVFWRGAKNRELLHKLRELVINDKDLEPYERTLTIDYIDLFLKIIEQIPNASGLDIHSGNIGYDFSGNLKLLDF